MYWAVTCRVSGKQMPSHGPCVQDSFVEQEKYKHLLRFWFLQIPNPTCCPFCQQFILNTLWKEERKGVGRGFLIVLFLPYLPWDHWESHKWRGCPQTSKTMPSKFGELRHPQSVKNTSFAITWWGLSRPESWDIQSLNLTAKQVEPHPAACTWFRSEKKPSCLQGKTFLLCQTPISACAWLHLWVSSRQECQPVSGTVSHIPLDLSTLQLLFSFVN